MLLTSPIVQHCPAAWCFLEGEFHQFHPKRPRRSLKVIMLTCKTVCGTYTSTKFCRGGSHKILKIQANRYLQHPILGLGLQYLCVILSKNHPIVFQVSWHISIYCHIVTNFSSSTGHHMTVSFVKRLC